MSRQNWVEYFQQSDLLISLLSLGVEVITAPVNITAQFKEPLLVPGRVTIIFWETTRNEGQSPAKVLSFHMQQQGSNISHLMGFISKSWFAQKVDEPAATAWSCVFVFVGVKMVKCALETSMETPMVAETIKEAVLVYFARCLYVKDFVYAVALPQCNILTKLHNYVVEI